MSVNAYLSVVVYVCPIKLYYDKLSGIYTYCLVQLFKCRLNSDLATTHPCRTVYISCIYAVLYI